MGIYICILRGINVSGQKLIKMEELRKGFESLGFTEVRTYIQSGNIVFRSEQSEDLERSIHEMILDQFGFDVPVIIRTPEALMKIVKDSPFKTEDPKTLYVSFLSSSPAIEQVDSMRDLIPDNEHFNFMGGKEIHMHLPNGYGKAKLNNNFLEKQLGVTATTRNWNTINKLISLSTS